MNEYLFEDRPISSFQRLAASSAADLIVFGHTHKPYVKDVDGVLFVNVGSVGKPKDGDWRACYAMVDIAALGPNLVRVPYDVQRAIAAVRATELPQAFADDLRATGAAPTEETR
jgi:predicted phosphodiesterase